MARPIVLSNSELHVGLNEQGLVHDFYYPYVGQENHTADGKLYHRIGVRVDGRFSWLDDGTWHVTLKYHYGTLISRVFARNHTLHVALEFDDFIDSRSSAFVRSIHVINDGSERTITLFMHQAFDIGANHNGDTAQYMADELAVLHYQGQRAFMVSAERSDGTSFDSFTVGIVQNDQNNEGTQSNTQDECATDTLSRKDTSYGRTDSALALVFHSKKHSSLRAYYWITAGETHEQALATHRRIKREGGPHLLLLTTRYWQHWNRNALAFALHLPHQYHLLATQSALLIKAHADKRGAVVTSSDSTLTGTQHDSYNYCWPRHASYALWPMIRLGYTDEARQFFAYCRRILHVEGYVLPSYRPDGAPGPNHHATTLQGNGVLPIQEDETALTLFLFGQLYKTTYDAHLLHEYYQTLVRPMANFLSRHINVKTHLPHPSYDLWEHTYLTTTYMTSVVYAALCEAASMADAMQDVEAAVRWQTIAEDMKRAARKLLFNEKRQFFYLGLTHANSGIEYSETVDASSFFGAFMFGLFDTDSNHMKQAYHTLIDVLANENGLSLSRYEHDTYMQHPGAKSNEWFVTTLWHAQYLIQTGNVAKGRKVLDWVKDRTRESGVLSEQISHSGWQLSVAPYLWSHGELLSTLLDLYDSEKQS